MTAEAAVTVAMLEARIDKLTQALLHVAGELWVARDRQAVLERVLSEGDADVRGRVEHFRPDAALTEALAKERDAFVAAVIGYLAPET